MIGTTSKYLMRLLEKYEEKTGKSKFKAAISLGVSLARYFPYRHGRGNPTSKMLNRIHLIMYEECPEIVIETILEMFDEKDLILLIEKMAKYFTEEHFALLVEKRKEYERKRELVLSGHIRNAE